MIVLLLAAASILPAGTGQETDSVLAAVNGDPITLGEILPAIREREFQLRSAYSGKALEKELLKLRRQTVEEIIDRKLIVEDFKKQNLILPPQEVENELDRWGRFIGCHSRRDLEERAAKSGTTIEKLRERMKQRMIVQVMRRREFLLAGLPTPADLYKRFKAEEKKLSFPGSVELGILKTAPDDDTNAEKIADGLKKDPGSWNLWAASFAITPGTNGNIGTVELDKLRPEFAKAMKEIKEKSLCYPIKTNDGIYFLKVIKYQPPRPARFKDHAEQIRKKMENEIYKKSSAGYAARLRDTAVIEYFFPAAEGVEKK